MREAGGLTCEFDVAAARECVVLHASVRDRDAAVERRQRRAGCEIAASPQPSGVERQTDAAQLCAIQTA